MRRGRYENVQYVCNIYYKQIIFAYRMVFNKITSFNEKKNLKSRNQFVHGLDTTC